MMKKFLFVTSIVLFFGLAPHVFADGFVPLAKIPGLTDVQPTQGGLADFFNNLYKYLIGLAAVFAVIEIIWGGLEISTKDSVSKQTDGKERIYNAIFGLVLVLSPVLVFSVINPNILNLSLNLPKLDTAPNATSSGSGPGTGPSGGTLDTATNCMVTGTLLKMATCPTQKGAEDFAAACSPGYGKFLNKCATNNSSGCADTSYHAACEPLYTGPYMFLDVSRAYVPVYSFSNYTPLASATDNSSNGADLIAFAATCSKDRGMTCLDPLGTVVSTTCANYTTPQPSSQSNRCYNIKIRCADNIFLNGVGDLCSSNPQWSPIK